MFPRLLRATALAMDQSWCCATAVRALMNLAELCAELHLDGLYPALPADDSEQAPAFDGFSLLLLTTPKLEAFLRRFRPEAPPGTAAQYMARIKECAFPLRLAYDGQPPHTSTAKPQVPQQLHWMSV